MREQSIFQVQIFCPCALVYPCGFVPFTCPLALFEKNN